MRGSENYVMTAHVESAGDMLELETVRKVVKVINSENADIEKLERLNLKEFPLVDYRSDYGLHVVGLVWRIWNQGV